MELRETRCQRVRVGEDREVATYLVLYILLFDGQR